MFPFRMKVECLHHQNLSFFHFGMMTPCDGIECSRVRCSTEFDISSTKVCSLFLYQKVWYFHMRNTDKQNISRYEHRELEPRGCETASRAGKGGFSSPILDESNQLWPGKFGSRCHTMQNVLEHFDLQKLDMWTPWLWYRQRISTFRQFCFGARCGISTSEGRNLSSEMWVQASIKPHHLSLKGQFRQICVPRN